MKTTQTRTGTYVHLETRDILTELDKASRKWPGRPRPSLGPVFPSQNQFASKDSVQLRFINHLIGRLNTEPGTIDVHLFATGGPQVRKLNQAIREFCNDTGRVNLIDADPADWAIS